jgi:hypothetical protein
VARRRCKTERCRCESSHNSRLTQRRAESIEPQPGQRAAGSVLREVGPSQPAEHLMELLVLAGTDLLDLEALEFSDNPLFGLG